MDIRSLEFFMAVCDKGSFNKAAECLYTSQPNVSRVIRNLEDELGQNLFERQGNRMVVTHYGETVKEYARVILKHSSMIVKLAEYRNSRNFTVATYPSETVSGIFAEFYDKWQHEYTAEHLEGSIESVSDWVSKGLAEIGFAYVAEKQLKFFNHILNHKKLIFNVMAIRDACIYVGPRHPRYNDESVDISELHGFKFISGAREYFSMEHHLTPVSLGVIDTADLNYVMYSNSDQTVSSMLLNTDVCSIGVNYKISRYGKSDIKALKINGCSTAMAIGYICHINNKISKPASWFISQFKRFI